MKTITESDMVFEFEDERVFLMEGSELHASVGTGIKTVEFIASVEESRLDFVEAKSSSPQPGNQKDFWGFINEISEKFLHSFALYLSAAIGRHQSIQSRERLDPLITARQAISLFSLLMVIKSSGYRPLKMHWKRIFLLIDKFGKAKS